MSDNTSQKDEEIDLGRLLALIGRGMTKLSLLFHAIFDFIVRVLLCVFMFFRIHFVKFVIVGILGFIVGLAIDKSKTPEYEATMVVRPNYQSGRQLYKNIAFYDELIKQKKFMLLSENFQISLDEAKSLVSFEIEPVINENYMLSTYDEFLSSIDSTVALNFDYDSYTDNFKDYSYSEHEITVVSTLNNLFPKLESTIISGIKDNLFFQQLEESERLILERNENYLKASLLKVDTLRKVYTEVLIKESERETSLGTNINMAGGKEDSKELDLFGEEQRINQSIDEISRKQVRKIEILNVISSFQAIGFERNGLNQRWIFKIPILLCSLLLMGLLGLKIEKSIFLTKE